MSEIINGYTQSRHTKHTPSPAYTHPQQFDILTPEDDTLRAFAQEQAIEGLSEPTLEKLLLAEPGYTLQRAKDFLTFQARINQQLLTHAIISKNDYTLWFESGTQTLEQMQDFVQQFSVFANLSLMAQLKKLINASDLSSMRDSKEILMNKLGVIFHPHHRTELDEHTPATQIDAISLEAIPTGRDHTQTAHFEWLLKLCEPLYLQFDDLGKRKHGSASTLSFCQLLDRLYGEEDPLTNVAAAYALENWSASGLHNKTSAQYETNFWVQLIKGLEAYSNRTERYLQPNYFTWHRDIAAQHARHTQEELEALYFVQEIDEARFITIGNDMLQGVATFWRGLDDQRKRL